MLSRRSPFHLVTGATALAWGLRGLRRDPDVARVFLATESALSASWSPRSCGRSARHRAVALGIVAGPGTARSRAPARRAADPARLAALLHRRPGAARGRGRPAPAAPRDPGVPVAQGREPRPDDAPAPRRPAPPPGSGGSSPWSPPSASCRPAASSTPPSSPRTDYGWTGLFTALILASAVFGVLGFWLGGRIGDLVGRRPMIALAIVMGRRARCSCSPGPRALPARLLPAAAAGSCFIAASLAYMAELFPTEVRAITLRLRAACQVAAGSVGSRCWAASPASSAPPAAC